MNAANLLLVLTALVALTGCGGRRDLTFTRGERAKFSPDDVLELAKEGNARFVGGTPYNRDMLHDQRETAAGQYPLAVLLSCIDSRVPAEIVFDAGIGDVFNARVAGNVVDPDILGSLEYSCAVAGALAIVVMGHSHCGAVKSACDGVEMGNITTLLEKIDVDTVEGFEGERSSKNPEFVAAVAESNVHRSMKLIREQSPILRELEERGEIVILGCMYAVETGRVEFYE